MSTLSKPIFQILACFAVAAAGLVPVFHKNRPFWGAYGISFDVGPPRIHTVDEDSPAADAGLQVDDVVLNIDGTPVDNEGLVTALESLDPGESVQLRVERGDAELDLTARAVEPPVAMIYYSTILHPIAGGLALAAGLIVLATQPLQPPPLWRGTIVLVVGLACAVMFFIAVTNEGPFTFWRIREYHNLNWGTRIHFEQTWVGLMGSLVLAVLAAWELRRTLAERRPASVDNQR